MKYFYCCSNKFSLPYPNIKYYRKTYNKRVYRFIKCRIIPVFLFFENMLMTYKTVHYQCSQNYLDICFPNVITQYV